MDATARKHRLDSLRQGFADSPATGGISAADRGPAENSAAWPLRRSIEHLAQRHAVDDAAVHAKNAMRRVHWSIDEHPVRV